jgi:hypothetical protein
MTRLVKVVVGISGNNRGEKCNRGIDHSENTPSEPRSRADALAHLGKLQQPGRRRPRRGDDDLRIVRPDFRILIIHMALWRRLRLVQHQILAAHDSRLIPQFRGQGLALREEILDALLAVVDRAFLRLLRFLVDVLAPFARLAAELQRVGRASGVGGHNE